MQGIKSSKAKVDKLSGRLLIYGADILAKPVSTVCNISIFQEFFPNACKIAKLKPVFKNGKNTNSSN